MTTKPADTPPTWAANENYSSGPDIGTLTKVQAAGTSDGHIAGIGNAPIAQNENFERAARDDWNQYFNSINSSVSFWNVAPGGVNTGGRVEFQFQTSAYPGQGPGDVPFDTAAGVENRTFTFPVPAGGGPAPGSYSIWEITAELVISTANAVSGDVSILRYDPGGGAGTELVSYDYTAQTSFSPEIVVPIRSHLLLSDGLGLNVIAISVLGNGGDLKINDGRLKIARIY